MANHWYDTEGKPKYTIIGQNGKERDTTLRDARKLKLVPSVTTILQVPAKPALIRWLQNQVLDACIDYAPPRRVQDQFEYKGWEEDVERWKYKIIEKSQKIGKDSAKRGSDIHNELEKYYSGASKIKHRDFIDPVIELLNEEFGDNNWLPEESFSHESGFGGKVDLHSPFGTVLDFKTKSGTANFDKDLGYDEHCMQLAAYREGLNLPKARCFNLFISTETPGLLQLKEWKEEEVSRGWEMFKCLLEYWKLQNNYIME